jgi:hypothetical protein
MGCTLTYTSKDHRQSFRSAEKAPPETKKISDERLSKIRSAMHRAPAELIWNILKDPNHRAHESIKTLIARSIGCSMEVLDLHKVAEALVVVLKDHPDAMGLFEKAPSHRGPGASPLSHHYEITSAAALKEATFKTLSGKDLFISPADRLDFGIKFARDYAQPKRYGTIEADILVGRGKNLVDEKTLAIDAKYSQTSIRGVPDQNELNRQCEGIRTGFKDGKINEFCFVTNGVFNRKFREMIDIENLRIAKDWVKQTDQLYRDIDKNILEPEERSNRPEDIISDKFFHKNNIEQVQEFIRKYDIPQIELCQHVKFRQN